MVLVQKQNQVINENEREMQGMTAEAPAPSEAGSLAGRQSPAVASSLSSTEWAAQCLKEAHEISPSISTETALAPVPDSTSPTIQKLIGSLSLLPIKEVVDFAKHPIGDILEKQKAAGGGPVFRGRFGLECVVCCDYVSGKFFLGASSTILDREPEKRFGPFGVDERFIGVQRPALISNDRNGHDKVRAFTVEMLRMRAKHVERTFEIAMDKAYADVFEKLRLDVSSMTMYEVAVRVAGEFQFQWLLECEAPDYKALRTYGVKSVSTLQTDSWLSNTTLSKLMAVQDMIKPEIDQVIAGGLEKVRASPVYPQYVELAKKMDYEQRDLDRLVLYTTNFNGTFATNFLLAGCMGVLVTQLATLDELRQELDGHKLTLANIDSFPLLDSFACEAMRFFLRPNVIFKKAQCDFEVPAGNGLKYAIKKDELVLGPTSLMQRDEKMFTNANQFNARRFITNPKLKEEVLNFGFVKNHGPIDKTKFGCAAHVTGFATKMNKLLIGALVQRVEWSLNQQPLYTETFAGEVGPNDIGFASFKPRSSGNM